jgi:hypothetical protein
MTIYSPKILSERTLKNFKPTRLAIKKLAGQYYFCKSTMQDFISYVGSGVVWRKRIKKYGKRNVETLWISDWYHDPYEIQQISLEFSKENNIVESSKWDNLWPENGLNGGKTTTVSPHKGKKICDNKNTIGVIVIESGLTLRISSEEFYDNRSKYKTFTENIVRDETYVSPLKGKITVRNSDGNTMKVAITDDRLSSGELTPLATKKVNVLDESGNSFSVSIDDPKY